MGRVANTAGMPAGAATSGFAGKQAAVVVGLLVIAAIIFSVVSRRGDSSAGKFVDEDLVSGGTRTAPPHGEAAPPAAAPKQPVNRGVSLAIATHRRAEALKLFIPRYLAVPIIRDIVICDDINSGDAAALRAWLPTSGIPPADQARVRIFENTTGERLGGFRNKVRCLALAEHDWVSLIDSDNFASPEHYWAPLIAHWTAKYGVAPPPAGNATAERRVMNPSAWMITHKLLSPGQPGQGWEDLGRVCDANGDLRPEPRTNKDPEGVVGFGCWEEAYKMHDVFFNHGNHVVHKPSILPPYKAAADLAAADPEHMDPYGGESMWFSYIAVSAGKHLFPVPGFYEDHLSGTATGNSWYMETAGKAMEFFKLHQCTKRPTTSIGPKHPL